MRMTPASPPGPWTVLVWTMESYCSKTQRLSQMLAAGEEFFEVGGVVAGLLQLFEDVGGRVFGDGRVPCADGTVVDGGVVGEGGVGDIGHEDAALRDAHMGFGGDLADDGGVEAPLGEDVEDFGGAGLCRRRGACAPAIRRA